MVPKLTEIAFGQTINNWHTTDYAKSWNMNELALCEFLLKHFGHIPLRFTIQKTEELLNHCRCYFHATFNDYSRTYSNIMCPYQTWTIDLKLTDPRLEQLIDEHGGLIETIKYVTKKANSNFVNLTDSMISLIESRDYTKSVADKFWKKSSKYVYKYMELTELQWKQYINTLFKLYVN